ncbi:MAG: dienelactone hydrolase family protein [Myxococcales bacterium]
MKRRAAPRGELATFAREHFEHHGLGYDVFRKGQGPAVLVLTEMPGISPQVLGFADRLVALGLTAVLPDLFGIAGRNPVVGGVAANGLYYARSMVSVCIRREFNILAAGERSPVVDLLRRLAVQEHQRCGGPGVGVIGMCFTGGFALAVAAEPCVLAPVLSQPSLPFAMTSGRRGSIDCEPEALDALAKRCAREDLSVLGLRFRGDPMVPKERFAYLREKLGDAFVAVELEQADGHPRNPLPRHHSVLTLSLIDEPGQPTRAALDRVLALFTDKLLGGAQAASVKTQL